jgi:hypothetical protein
VAPGVEETLRKEHPRRSGITIQEVLNSYGGRTFIPSFRVVIPSKYTGRLRVRKQFRSLRDAERCAEQAVEGLSP